MEGRAQDLWGRTAQRWHEVSDWVVDNRLDLLLASIAALVIAVVLLTLRRYGHHLIRERGEVVSWRTVFGSVLARTKIFFIVIAAFALVSSQSEPPEFLRRLIEILFIVAAALQAAIWGRELVLGYIQHRIGDHEDQGRLSSAIGIIRLFVTVALFAIALVVILDNLGVNVTGLVAGLGIGGIAIGLAAQGIFSDLFAALAIIFDRPFRRGDTVSFGQPPTTGTVEQIGLKTTRIRSLGGEEVVIANAKLLEQQLQNFTLLNRRRAVVTFGLVYQTPPDLLAAVPGECEEIVEAEKQATFDRCHATAFAPSSIDFELVFHVESPEIDDFMRVRQAVLLAMIRRFTELGVQFAYPTQTTFTAAPDGTLVMPYAPPAPRAS